jgi:hypothetical protein
MAPDTNPHQADESGSEPADAAPALQPAADSQAAPASQTPAQQRPPAPAPAAGPLPNIRGVGAFLAGLEQKIFGRQPVQDVVEDHSLHNRRTVGGVTLEFDPDPPQRPEPEDHSGAKL